jgi:hypothetical protein
VRRTPPEEVVEFLSFSRGARAHGDELEKFSSRDWTKVLAWLDDAGLAFYFLSKLKNTNTTDRVPTWAISRLETNFAANQQRVEDMSHRFGLLNRSFDDAGVRYAVLKGLSNVPQFCPDATLRHQGDFDYLVDEPSLPVARQVLLAAGYSPKPSLSQQQFIFVKTGMGKPSRTAEQYSAQSPHAVELHLDIWDREQNRLPLLPRLFFVEQARIHNCNQLSFPALADEDAFLLQILHACQHLFTLWIRMSCLFEIGYFLNRRAFDTTLWGRIEQRVKDNLVLREFVVIVAELVTKLFSPALPSVIRNWGRTIRPGSRVWIESYARHWAFSEVPVYEFRLFPTAKLALFLHQQYRDETTHTNLVRAQVLPFSRLSRIASSLRNKPSLVLNLDWWKRQRLISRGLFHALAGLRYFCEIPRWLWLNRARVRVNRLRLDSNSGVG